jgi:hypothetical protein
MIEHCATLYYPALHSEARAAVDAKQLLAAENRRLLTDNARVVKAAKYRELQVCARACVCVCVCVCVCGSVLNC